jgi:2-polyprenyl-3-methyl-5-hydroxy-6-metoxy-1,4-benzoquinol methylase
MSGRELTGRDLAYEQLGPRPWAKVISGYDTKRRIRVLVDEFLGPDRLRGRDVLEAGCGLGFFSRRIWAQAPARLVAVDLAPSMVATVQHALPQVECRVGDLLNLSPGLGTRTFDVVLSSEVIEHTPDPLRAVEELCRRVRPGGWLALSCPNRRWRWLLNVARFTHLRRHYQGYENWVAPGLLLETIERAGLRVVRAEGIHCLPWQVMPKGLLQRLDDRCRTASYGRSINLAVLAQRSA